MDNGWPAVHLPCVWSSLRFRRRTGGRGPIVTARGGKQLLGSRVRLRSNEVVMALRTMTWLSKLRRLVTFRKVVTLAAIQAAFG